MITDAIILYFNSKQQTPHVFTHRYQCHASKRGNMVGNPVQLPDWAFFELANRALCWQIRYKIDPISEQKIQCVDRLGWLKGKISSPAGQHATQKVNFPVAGFGLCLQSHSLTKSKPQGLSYIFSAEKIKGYSRV
jgi:hypothetical protein